MVVVGLIVWTQGSVQHPAMTGAIFSIIEVMMLILGVMLGFIGYGVIIVIVIIGIVGLSFYVKTLLSTGG